MPAQKLYRNGTHRSRTPDETVAWVKGLAPVMGITRIANVTGLDSIGIPVTMVCRPNSRSISVSQGKGATLDAARASGLMESVELFHAEGATFPLRLASYLDLRYSTRVADPAQLPSVKGSRFHPMQRILWCEGRDLLAADQSVFVPFELVHMDATQPLPGAGCFPCGSNGLASGNNLPEAIAHGLCELVERDAMTMWMLRGALDETRVNPDTVDEPGCRELLDKFARAGIAVGVWEITSDVGIAAFTCLILPEREGVLRHEAHATGHGCHPARAVALSRALTECAQSRLTMIAGARDDAKRENYRGITDRDGLAKLRARLAADATRDFRNAPNFDGASIDEDLAWSIERVRGAGVEQVIVVDLTRREFGIPVARVIAPGLETAVTPQFMPGARARAVLASKGSA